MESPGAAVAGTPGTAETARPRPGQQGVNTRDIVVVGASAGGVWALRQLMAALPADFPAAVFVAMHTSPEVRSELPHILGRDGPLPASHAKDGEPIEHGHVYVAPPDRHLLVERGSMLVVHGPHENRHRPAIDP